jgi:hypothetical protein
MFAALNSGLWFFHNLGMQTGSWVLWVTGIWGLVLLAHGIYVLAIANYSDPLS